ncbi:MAG TPA: DUF6306 domain-containing protein [Acidocella sp.]|nr:DUF6306 domain-containing protein [Acidocella sp.]
MATKGWPQQSCWTCCLRHDLSKTCQRIKETIMPLYRPVCDLLGCTYPVVLAGMGGVSRADLVVAVTEAGGFGFFGMAREPPALIRSEIQRVRAGTRRRFGVNLVPAETDAGLLEAQIANCIETGVPVIGLFSGLSTALVQSLRRANIVVVCQAGSAWEARAAQEAGAHVVIAQGCEAGGHVRGETPLQSLLPDVVASVNVPVLAAGGIVSGADVATALALGAQGAVIDTASVERLGDTISDAVALMDVCVELPGEPEAFASAACSADEMDDVYMGFAGREELLVSLNDLLEAERAGLRVALRTAADIEDPSLNKLMTGIHRGGARWCGVLTRAILSLKGTPSTRTGVFYEQAMAIADLPQRLAFLNKSEAWVVRRLRALSPKIRSDCIHGDIMAMLVSHEETIKRVASHFPPGGDPSAAAP